MHVQPAGSSSKCTSNKPEAKVFWSGGTEDLQCHKKKDTFDQDLAHYQAAEIKLHFL